MSQTSIAALLTLGAAYRHPFLPVLALALAIVAAPHALAQQVTIGGDSNPSDPATVDGSVDLTIGQNGTGALDIKDGGTLTDGTGFVGNHDGSVGNVTLSSSNGSVSTWINAGDLVVGQNGTADLTIQDSSEVTNQNGYIGATTGSVSRTVAPSNVTVSGSGSTWSNSSQLFVGDAGTGELDILGGGLVESGIGLVGNQNGGNGAVTVSGYGSYWNNSNQIDICNEGTGTLSVENGGMVTSSEGDIGGTTGSADTGDGTVTVSGNDGDGHASTWNTGNVYVGFMGTGRFNIFDGGLVTSDGGGGAAATGYIGYSSGSTGIVTVSSSTGDVSTWTVTNDIEVGVDGVGTLNVEKGGKVHVATDVTIGVNAGSSGRLNLLGDTSGRGVLETGSVIKGDGTAIFNFNGGILRATRDETDFLQNFGTQAISIGANGAVIDTNGYDIGIAPRFDGTGGLTKDGAGTLALTGTSTYTGPTDVNAGSLLVNGSIANSAVLVHDRASCQAPAPSAPR
ncbi:hypothetical protein DTW90_34775 [Neorhizobium sp. P12A]|uniref:autotransporter-associated beta strand repeat-containing protein n=1 Tax=Neorhizobium sp. P12A TaxID=2268027 RepID=UPI0011F0576B|nr:autotransporter-associated beta strand repeat-containing protein [Neorhizobium sp. P12A]KAA0685953.1 hypothetical protein DTW90_34775 [Neorhizobium sp. P12A]